LRIQFGIAPARKATIESMVVATPSQYMTANTMMLVTSAITDPIAYRVILPASADSRARLYRAGGTTTDPSG